MNKPKFNIGDEVVVTDKYLEQNRFVIGLVAKSVNGKWAYATDISGVMFAEEELAKPKGRYTIEESKITYGANLTSFVIHTTREHYDSVVHLFMDNNVKITIEEI